MALSTNGQKLQAKLDADWQLTAHDCEVILAECYVDAVSDWLAEEPEKEQ